jgi:hypothetical protein
MKLITDTFRQLVRRRLWPVAALLLAAVVAVPLALAKSPAPAPPTPTTVAAKSDDVTTTFVALDDQKSAERRRVLGRTKDPFEPAPLPKAKKRKSTKAKAAATATATPTATPDSSSSSGGGTSAPGTPVATPTPTPSGPTVPKGSLKVRFGKVDDTSAAELPSSYLQPLEPLLDDTTPVLVFEHVTNEGKTAVFSIPGDVSAVGDGKCDPTPQNCETLKLHAGETEFVTVAGTAADGSATSTQYELDLVKIYQKKTVVPAESAATTG